MAQRDNVVDEALEAARRAKDVNDELVRARAQAASETPEHEPGGGSHQVRVGGDALIVVKSSGDPSSDAFSLVRAANQEAFRREQAEIAEASKLGVDERKRLPVRPQIEFYAGVNRQDPSIPVDAEGREIPANGMVMRWVNTRDRFGSESSARVRNLANRGARVVLDPTNGKEVRQGNQVLMQMTVEQRAQELQDLSDPTTYDPVAGRDRMQQRAEDIARKRNVDPIKVELWKGVHSGEPG